MRHAQNGKLGMGEMRTDSALKMLESRATTGWAAAPVGEGGQLGTRPGGGALSASRLGLLLMWLAVAYAEYGAGCLCRAGGARGRGVGY